MVLILIGPILHIIFPNFKTY